LAVTVEELSDVFRAARPPRIVQRVVLAVLAPLGHRPVYTVPAPA
jgi:hypothetical protein